MAVVVISSRAAGPAAPAAPPRRRAPPAARGPRSPRPRSRGAPRGAPRPGTARACAQDRASSSESTLRIQNPPTSSLASVNGPSLTVGSSPSNVTAAPWELGARPSPASSTPASTIAVLNRPISSKIAGSGGVSFWAFSSYLSSSMKRIGISWTRRGVGWVRPAGARRSAGAGWSRRRAPRQGATPSSSAISGMRRTWSVTPGPIGQRRAHCTASSRDATSSIQNPATSSLASVNGPSVTLGPSPSWVTRNPSELGARPSAASRTPASTSSVL